MYLFIAANHEQKRHHAIRVLWSQRYYCHRQARRGAKGRNSDGEAYNDDEEDDDYDDDGVQRRPVQKKSKHLDCKAHLIVKCFKDTPEVVDIAYIGDHTGHVPGSIEAVQFLHKSDELNEQILQELKKGYNVRDVRRYLQRVY